MSLFRFPWVRKWFRRNTRPIPEADAFKWRRRLSLAYAAIAWNSIGVIFYYMMTSKSNEKQETAPEYYIRILNLDKVKVKRYANFQKVDEYEYDRSKLNKDSAEGESGDTSAETTEFNTHPELKKPEDLPNLEYIQW